MAINPDSHRWYGVLDVKTDGPHGGVVTIGAVIYRSPDDIVDEFFARMPDAFVRQVATRELLLPLLTDERPTHQTYRAMLDDFARWYIRNSPHTSWLGSGATYLEYATLFRDTHKHGLLAETGHPPHIIDVFSVLLTAPGEQNTMTIEEYVGKHALPLLVKIDQPVHPIRTCVALAAVYFDVMRRASKATAVVDLTGATSYQEHAVKIERSDTPPEPQTDSEMHLPVPAAASDEPTEGFVDSPAPVRPAATNGSKQPTHRELLAELGADEDDDINDKPSKRMRAYNNDSHERSSCTEGSSCCVGQAAAQVNQMNNRCTFTQLHSVLWRVHVATAVLPSTAQHRR